ncbi:MAG: LysR family transcriptional regulator [Verrucomicrobiales bacterium]|nr:LysR family transcriptional regulator [Verrucomicrobiales bacterium]
MELLNFHHLRYFWVAAKEGGLTRAAAKLHVSQPSICTQIHALENVLGEKLLRRSGQGLVLTEAGQRVFGFAEDIFALGEDLLSTMKQRPSRRPLRIHIGLANSLPKRMSFELIKPVFQLPQPVQASFHEWPVADLLAHLAAHRIDIVLADAPAPAASNLKVFNHLLGESGISLCAAPVLATRLRRRFPDSLNDTPALLPAPDTPLRRSLESWFRDQAIQPRLVAEFDDPALMQVLAAEGLGFFPLPEVVLKETLARYGLRRIGRAEPCRQQYYAICAERRLVHPAVVAITSQAQALLR